MESVRESGSDSMLSALSWFRDHESSILLLYRIVVSLQVILKKVLVWNRGV